MSKSAPLERRPFPLVALTSQGGGAARFQDVERMFTHHPTYGVRMGMTTGDQLSQAIFVKFTQETPVNVFPSPYYIIVLRGGLRITGGVGQDRTFAVGSSLVQIDTANGTIEPCATHALALILTTKPLPHTVAMQPVKKGSEEAFNLVTLKVLPKGLSGIETRFVTLDRTWGPGLKTSPTIDVLGMSLCDAHRDLTAPLHPAYSKYLNWTTWLSDGRAEFATSNGQTAEVGRGDIVLFDDSEGDGHAYRVANGLPVKQVFITLAQEVTRYGTGPTGFEAGLEGRAWDEKPKAKL